jgi:hypothetical protein
MALVLGSINEHRDWQIEYQNKKTQNATVNGKKTDRFRFLKNQHQLLVPM